MLNYDNTGVTVELDELVRSGIDIWDFDYPSYYKDEEKTAFEQKVIDHYRFRQIGQETPARWLHYFRSRIREIMPYYLQLYKSVEIMDAIKDPFGNIDVTETFKETRSGSSSGSVIDESSGTNKNTVNNTDTENSQHIHSDTPQGSISNLENYMSEADKDNKTVTTNGSTNQENSSSSNQVTSSTDSGTVEHTFHKQGNQGVNTYAHDMIEFRQTFINVDMMIIDELKDLFLQVY